MLSACLIVDIALSFVSIVSGECESFTTFVKRSNLWILPKLPTTKVWVLDIGRRQGEELVPTASASGAQTIFSALARGTESHTNAVGIPCNICSTHVLAGTLTKCQ